MQGRAAVWRAVVKKGVKRSDEFLHQEECHLGSLPVNVIKLRAPSVVIGGCSLRHSVDTRALTVTDVLVDLHTLVFVCIPGKVKIMPVILGFPIKRRL